MKLFVHVLENYWTRRLETPEFVRWFEQWYGNASEYKDDELKESYFSERRFAVMGWVAAKMDADKLSNAEFISATHRLANVTEKDLQPDD